MKKIMVGSAFALVMTMGLVANENTEQNMALKLGTLGLGVDFSTPISENMTLRFNVNGATTTRQETVDTTKYDATLKLLTVGALFDYYLSESDFRLTAGAYYNANKFDLVATPTVTQSINIGNHTYTIDDIGHVNSSAEFNKIAPYIGIGWGNKPTSKKGWGFTFDLGAMYQGTATVTAEAIVNNSVPQLVKNQIASDIDKERVKIEDQMGSYTWYPVVMIGVNYTF